MNIKDVMIDTIAQPGFGETCLVRMTHQPTNISVESISPYDAPEEDIRLYLKLQCLVDEHLQQVKDKLPLARCVEGEAI